MPGPSRLVPPSILPTIPPGVVPGERRITNDQILGKPAPGSNPVALKDIPGQATAVREFLRSLGTGTIAGTPAWDTLQLADLPTNASATRKFLRSVSSGAAAWDTLSAADVLAGTFPAGNFTFPGVVDVSAAGLVVPTGSWTPTDDSGAGLALTTSGTYFKLGRVVIAFASISYPVTADGSTAKWDGLPFVVANAQAARQGFISFGNGGGGKVLVASNTTKFQPTSNTSSAVTNASMSGTTNLLVLLYYV